MNFWVLLFVGLEVVLMLLLLPVVCLKDSSSIWLSRKLFCRHASQQMLSSCLVQILALALCFYA